MSVAAHRTRTFRRTVRLELSQIIVWVIGSLLLAIVAIGSVLTLRAGHYSAAQWRDFIVFGIAQGAIYALIALGYTMVYGVLRMINFAHGEVFMSGAMTTFFLADALNRSGFLKLHPWITLLALLLFSGCVSMIVAVLVERIAYRPLRHAPRLVPLITAVGASFFLQYTFRGLFGSGVRAYPAIPVLQGKLWFFQKTQLAVFVTVVITLILLVLFLQRTRAGLAIRAVAEDAEAAALMGIDIDRTIMTTFALGGFLAGIAGILYALVFAQVQFLMGFLPGIKAFTAAVLGGIGNLPGAAVGGLVLGIIESVGPSLFFDGYGIRAAHQLKDVIGFTILVLILIFRPTGLLGERLGGEDRV